MKKYEVLRQVEREKIIAIMRVQNAEQAERGLDALIEGGLNCVELTFTVPYAHTILEKLSEKYRGTELCLGAGSVLDGETARIAILSGARYLVTPTFSCGTVRVANRYGVPTFAGVSTPTEALQALESGVDVIKLFPASAFAPRIIKDWKAPLSNLEIVPVGGISIGNVQEWLRAGAFACGVGGSLFEGLKSGNYGAIRNAAAEFVKKAREVDNDR